MSARTRRRAAIYARLSPKPKRKGQVVVDDTGVDRQIEDSRALAARLGVEVVETYEDRLVSAYSTKPRPAFERLLADLSRYDVILVWHPDRFIRNSAELERVIPLLDAADVPVESVVAGSYDLSNEEGRFQARIHGAIATRESGQKAERIRRKHEALAAEGKSAGGGRAFGFEDGNAVVRESEALVVKELVARVLDGESLISLVEDLNTRGITATRGGRWTTTSLRGLLRNPRIAGIRTRTEKGRDGKRSERVEVGLAAWPALVDVEDFRAVEALLSSRTRQRRDARLLTGFLVCGNPGCGARLVSSRRAPIHGGHRVYICNRRTGRQTGCFRNSILAEPLEEILDATFLAYVENVSAPERSELLDAARRELDVIDAKRARLGKRYAAARTEEEEAFVLSALDDLSERARVAQETIRREVEKSSSAMRDLFSGDLAARWPTMTVEEKRSKLPLFVERVVIGPAVPGRPFDESRILGVDYYPLR